MPSSANADRPASVTLEQARDRLYDLCRHEYGIVKAPPGSGKSEAAVRAGWDRICESPDTCAVGILAGLTKRQVADWAKVAERMQIPHVVVRGRDESNCRQFEAAHAVGALGYSAFRAVCSSCRHQTECGYRQTLQKLERCPKRRLIFCAHESVPLLLALFHHTSRAAGPFVIYDESPERALIQQHEIDFTRWQQRDESRAAVDCSGPGDRAGLVEDYSLPLQDAERLRIVLTDVLDDARWAACDGDDAAMRSPRMLIEHVVRCAARRGWSPADLLSDSLADQLEVVLEGQAARLVVGSIADVKLVYPRYVPAVVRALARDYRRLQSGTTDWNSPLAVVATGHGGAKLRFAEHVEIPHLPRDLLVLDGTADPDRIRRLFRRPDLPLHVVDLPIVWRAAVHVQTNASRRRMQERDRARLDAYVRRALVQLHDNGTLTPQQRVLVVSHGSSKQPFLEKHFANVIQEIHQGPVEARHFGELRGSNGFNDFDAVVTIGDNEPAPFELLDRYRCVYGDDDKPLSVEMKFEKGGGRWMVDERLDTFRRCWTEDEIAQAAFRTRPLMHPGKRIFVHVGAAWPGRHVGAPHSVINPHVDFGHQLVRDYVGRLVARAGCFSNILAYAAGWAKPETEWRAQPVLHGRMLGLPNLHDALCVGLELPPRAEGAEPYTERGLRDVVGELLKDLPVAHFQPASVGVTGMSHFLVFGDVGRFTTMFSEAA